MEGVPKGTATRYGGLGKKENLNSQKEGTVAKENGATERLGNRISTILSGRDILQVDIPVLDGIADKMELNPNVTSSK
jgi:hypothetical protein